MQSVKNKKKTLALKYRPKTFDDLTEQTSIKLILEEQIKTNTFKNGYLFFGAAGTGKTTSARIFASMINGGEGRPYEIDAASNNGVDNVRAIIEQAKTRSLETKYKIFILDEVHMFSKGAWNAMLKLLEEPPTNTIFIMCTTEDDNIPATILSRVQRYDFNRISFDGIVKRLKHILNYENEEKRYDDDGNFICDENYYEVDDEAIEYIAKVADGGMRDAITSLDKCLSFNSSLTIKEVTEVLGTVNYSVMFDITDNIYEQENMNASLRIQEIYNSGVNLKQFMRLYRDFLVDVLKYIKTKSYKDINIPSTYEIPYTTEHYAFIYDLLKSIMAIIAECKKEQNPRPFIEAAIITMEV